MCVTCGCSGQSHLLTAFSNPALPVNVVGLTLSAEQPQRVAPATYQPEPPTKTLLEVERDVLDKNNRMAERNRGYCEAKNILAVNLVSSPGSGKTAILERTLKDMADRLQFFVIEGDQQTTRDAERIAASGVPVIQVNTGKGCHLDADMVHEAIRRLQPSDGSILMIENVGNLVCPAAFDLGETRRVVAISITEGEDKPLKYPDMFHSAQLCLINKIDLLPYLQFDIEKLKEYARQVNPALTFIEVSATRGDGMDAWYAWLEKEQVEHYNIEPVI